MITNHKNLRYLGLKKMVLLVVLVIFTNVWRCELIRERSLSDKMQTFCVWTDTNSGVHASSAYLICLAFCLGLPISRI